eukprot:1137682-Pelagomonas_calceolata.AAC.1
MWENLRLLNQQQHPVSVSKRKSLFHASHATCSQKFECCIVSGGDFLHTQPACMLPSSQSSLYGTPYHKAWLLDICTRLGLHAPWCIQGPAADLNKLTLHIPALLDEVLKCNDSLLPDAHVHAALCCHAQQVDSLAWSYLMLWIAWEGTRVPVTPGCLFSFAERAKGESSAVGCTRLSPPRQSAGPGPCSRIVANRCKATADPLMQLNTELVYFIKSLDNNNCGICACTPASCPYFQLDLYFSCQLDVAPVSVQAPACKHDEHKDSGEKIS